MFILAVLVLALLVALLRGGKLSNLALIHIRWRAVILLGFMLQVLIFSPFWQQEPDLRALTSSLYLVSLGMLLVALVVNWHLPGAWLLALGFALNFIVIAVNGGYMPSGYLARALAGRQPLQPGEVVSNSIGMGPDTPLAFLGDIFAIPQVPVFSNVFSIGDILISLGGFLLIQGSMQNPAALDPAAQAPDAPAARVP